MLQYKKSQLKNICCLGAGYVGGPTMAVIANNCRHLKVNVVDISKERIKQWNSKDLDDIPVYEPGLIEILEKTRNVNLFFTNELENSIKEADMIFISVNTPTKVEGFGAGFATDLKWIESSARKIAEYSKGHTIVVEKSTVPVKTAKLIETILISNKKITPNEPQKTFSILSSPEFLSEGTAIEDLENPDRVLIGGDDDNAIRELKMIYKYWINEEKILVTNLWSSELSKLSANAFLAQRISSINSISALCEVTGAKINEIANSIGLDKRIGPRFLSAGPGFGGSCFQKDILSLVYLCRYYGLVEVADYWEQVITLNKWQRKRISGLIVDKLFNTVSQKKILILGFSYKPNTNDTRESSSIFIAKDLLSNGAKLLIHDPQVSASQIENVFDLIEGDFYSKKSEGQWEYCIDIEKNSIDADAIVILTEWNEYKNLDWAYISSVMRKPAWVFDTRSVLESEVIIKLGINLWQVGNGFSI